MNAAGLTPAHTCPATACTHRLSGRLLMCRAHWRMVPPAAQRAVYSAYAGGAGLGTTDLYDAQIHAIRLVNAQLERTTPDA